MTAPPRGAAVSVGVFDGVHLGHQGIIQAAPLYARVKALLEEFLLAGGGGFLEGRQADARKRRVLSRSVVAAIHKYIGEDDRYPPLELENYPPFVRKALLFLFTEQNLVPNDLFLRLVKELQLDLDYLRRRLSDCRRASVLEKV